MNLDLKNLTEDLLVVLVLFKCTLQESAAFVSLTQALKSDRCSIFIYDNSPQAQVCSNKDWDISYVHDASNPGVSKAYNEGFKRAKELQKHWMLLVDQDTDFPINVFEKYAEAIRENTYVAVPILRDNRGIVSPLKFSFGGGQRLKHPPGNSKLDMQDYFFHNSGLLISVSIFEKAGMYDEKLRLDFSDFSFVHKLRYHEKHFAMVDVHCNQNMASTSQASAGERLARFKSYALSATYFRKKYERKNFMIPVRVFLRAVKLTWQYKDFCFINSYFR